MRPTRRGYAVIGIVVIAIASAALFGARGLNAIAGPGVVALGYATIQVWRIDEPTLKRRLPRRGEQGSSVTVELELEVDQPYSARLEDVTGEGLTATENERAVTVGGAPIQYELTLRRRGDRTVGPTILKAHDVLGLVSRRFELGTRSSLLVRPPVYPLSGPRADDLIWMFGGGDERREFDFLRHYQRGDPLRDIHWPSSAKIPGEGLVVKHFSTDEGASGIRVAGESKAGHTDEMAAATASMAVHLLTAGHRIEFATADQTLDARGGAEQRDRVLDALARTDGGPLLRSDREAADVLISAGPEGVTVTVGDTSSPFAEVAGREISIPTQADPERGLTNRLGGLA